MATYYSFSSLTYSTCWAQLSHTVLKKVTTSILPLADLKRADFGILLIKNTCVISDLRPAFFSLSPEQLTSEQTWDCNCSVMRYQFTCKAILLISLCSVGLSGLKLHCKAIEGSYTGDPVSQFDKRAEWRLWHRRSSSGCHWHSTGLGPGRAAIAPPLIERERVLTPLDLRLSSTNSASLLPTHDSLVLVDKLLPLAQTSLNPLPLFLSLSHSGSPSVILGSGEWPPLSNPPFESKFNCLWHHVWLLRATRQPGRDCGVQRASTNSLRPSFFPPFLSVPPTLFIPHSSCKAEVSPPESSSDQLFSASCPDSSGKTLSPLSWRVG